MMSILNIYIYLIYKKNIYIFNIDMYVDLEVGQTWSALVGHQKVLAGERAGVLSKHRANYRDVA